MNACITLQKIRSENCLKISGKYFLIEIYQKSKSKVSINVLNSQPDSSEISFIKKFVSEWLDLSYDLKPFYKFAQKDKLLKPVVAKVFRSSADRDSRSV